MLFTGMASVFILISSVMLLHLSHTVPYKLADCSC